MQKSERFSLRQRLLLWLLLPLLALTACWAWAAHAIVLSFANQVYDRWLEDTVRTLAEQVQVEQGRVTVDLPPAARRMLEFDEVDKVYFSVVDASGRQLVGNQQLPPPAQPDLQQTADFYDSQLHGQPLRLVEYRVPAPTTDALVYVRVAETLRKREMLASEVLAVMMVPQALLLVGLVVLVWYGIGAGIAPLRRVRDAIARRTHTDLSPLDERGLPAEVHEQVHVINGLMSRLNLTITAQQRFIADATHQLRTPITVLRTQTELALRLQEPAELHAFMQKLDGATVRLARLANQLLNLSRAEAGLAGALQLVPVSVTEWVEDVVAALVPAALDKQTEMRLQLGEPALLVHGDAQLLSEMLANLVDNAVRYTPADGQIHICVQPADHWLQLQVTDNGPGIAPAERQQVLTRFYRSSAAAGAEGSGLGLAIVQEIVQLHHGQLELSAPPGDRGLQVTVRLPLLTAPTEPTTGHEPAF
jgi:two-component system sensor histidine kinase TctE